MEERRLRGSRGLGLGLICLFIFGQIVRRCVGRIDKLSETVVQSRIFPQRNEGFALWKPTAEETPCSLVLCWNPGSTHVSAQLKSASDGQLLLRFSSCQYFSRHSMGLSSGWNGLSIQILPSSGIGASRKEKGRTGKTKGNASVTLRDNVDIILNFDVMCNVVAAIGAWGRHSVRGTSTINHSVAVGLHEEVAVADVTDGITIPDCSTAVVV
ncbi:hypothetical protein AXG93_2782s1030 [Marchantia polymorpha subsp. ruderalis]|uniref:Uncharacterized protein n=1 Tax=Marchantia polymorpha subsp. ruderalis TaxID=1480154 RepID=A0A176WQY1_MARPO|nr:hypothetical protein AXG93_2782s1030 [Marchantia polymorpha subsp. ruderalis]